METKHIALIDGSKLTVEALARAGADAFVGYPITPSNLMYAYAKQRMPVFLAAPDEITTLQWMAGMSAAGKVPVTSSAFPGIALMVESINMAYAMELPMVIILTQRLGPSTGSATTGAQGDLMLLKGIISGGYPVPVFSPSDFTDIWHLAAKALETAVKYRTPVFFLTSKEMIMTQKAFDLELLDPIEKVHPDTKVEGEFKPYKPGKNLTPPYIPLGNDEYLTRITASTHDQDGNIRKAEPEALENAKRLRRKLVENMDDYLFYDWQQSEGKARKLIVTWGITAEAVRDAVKALKKRGEAVDVLIVKTLLPVADEIYDIIGKYDKVYFAEENLTGQYKEILFGEKAESHHVSINKIGSMITPEEIVRKVSN